MIKPKPNNVITKATFHLVVWKEPVKLRYEAHALSSVRKQIVP